MFLQRIRVDLVGWVLLSVLFAHAISSAEAGTYREENLGFETSYLSNSQEDKNRGRSALLLRRSSIDAPASISIDVAWVGSYEGDLIEDIRANPQSVGNILKERFPDSEVLEDGDTFLGGRSAYYILSRYQLANLGVRVKIAAIQMLCVRGNRLYLVTFEAPLAAWHEARKEFQANLSSFNFF